MSGADSNWMAKLIDVYVGTMPDDPTMGGYELPISLDIFLGRYRTSFDYPEAVTPNKPLLYQFGLPMVDHVFLPDTASWCGFSQLSSRFMTATHKPLCQISSMRNLRITRRQPNGYGICREMRASSIRRSFLNS